MSTGTINFGLIAIETFSAIIRTTTWLRVFLGFWVTLPGMDEPIVLRRVPGTLVLVLRTRRMTDVSIIPFCIDLPVTGSLFPLP